MLSLPCCSCSVTSLSVASLGVLACVLASVNPSLTLPIGSAPVALVVVLAITAGCYPGLLWSISGSAVALGLLRGCCSGSGASPGVMLPLLLALGYCGNQVADSGVFCSGLACSPCPSSPPCLQPTLYHAPIPTFTDIFYIIVLVLPCLPWNIVIVASPSGQPLLWAWCCGDVPPSVQLAQF